jgi:hypothetical protein
MRSQKKYDEHVATEEEDQTGDSGMGTGSGTTSYGTIEEWKGSIQNPPPGMMFLNCVLLEAASNKTHIYKCRIS